MGRTQNRIALSKEREAIAAPKERKALPPPKDAPPPPPAEAPPANGDGFRLEGDRPFANVPSEANAIAASLGPILDRAERLSMVKVELDKVIKADNVLELDGVLMRVMGTLDELRDHVREAAKAGESYRRAMATRAED